MKNTTRIISIIIFLSASLMLVSSGGQKAEWKGKIDEENGVIVVKNPKQPMYGEEVFSIKEELSIGVAKGNEEYMFSQARDIDVDEEEKIYILDMKECHIKVFNKNGEYLKTIGKEGQGPGEMRLPGALVITPQQEILVNDSSARKLHFFTLDGKFLRAVSQTKMFLFSSPKADHKGNIVAGYMIAGQEVIYELKKFDPQLKELFTIFSTKVLKYPYLNPFFPRCYWEVTKEDNIIWGFPDKYELQVLNPGGKLLKKIVKDHTPIKITQEEKDDIINETFGGYDNLASDAKLLWDKHHNAFIYLSLDDAGRIFVRTYEKAADGKAYYYDVFDSEGKYIAKIPLKARPIVWKMNKLYTIEEDEEGLQMVKRYRVSWKY
jgi:hypothetical protein